MIKKKGLEWNLAHNEEMSAAVTRKAVLSTIV
jgi:hypothetical protein